MLLLVVMMMTVDTIRPLLTHPKATAMLHQGEPRILKI